MKKRIISMALVLLLVFSMLPVSAMADEAGTGLSGSVDIQEVISDVKDLISGGGDISAQLEDILAKLDYNELAAVFAALIKDKVDITPVLDKVDMNELAAVVKQLVDGNIDISEIVEKLDTAQIVELIKNLAGDNETIGAIIENLPADQLAEVIKALVAGDADIGQIIAGLDTAQIVELIKNLAGDNETIGAIIENLPADQLAEVIKALVAGDADIGQIIAGLDTAQIVELIKNLAGDNETIGAIIEYIPMNTLAAVVKALVAGDADISGIIASLDKDELAALVTALIGDNETIGAILEQLDIEQIVELVKALIDGNVDISGILNQLDPYELVQVVAGLIGSDLDVTDPKNVTVTETETASFSVKINRSNIMGIPTDSTDYKYMWLEPEAVSKLDFSSIDFQNSSTVSIALKVITKLAALSLSDTDKLDIKNTTMSDNGRSFVCLIYHIEIGGSTMHITDKATLTVTPLSDCEHKNLSFVRGVSATCTETGNIPYYECSTCHKLFEDNTCTTQTNAKDVILPAVGHTEYESKPAVAPTCTKTGLTAEMKCSACGETLKSQKIVAATGHSPTEGRAALEPTCTNTGLTAQTVCSVCGVELVAQKVVPAKGHTKVVDTEAVAATCTSDGRTEASHCGVCGDVLSVSTTVKATGHNFGGDIQCANCGIFVPFPFTDVPVKSWYRGDVEYVWQNRLMNGMTKTTFEPQSEMTREMFVTVLYRLSGAQYDPSWVTPFKDLYAQWSHDAILWAYNNGITNGKSHTIFDPTAPISRAEIVTMLYRYSGSPATGGALRFTDSSAVPHWAYTAVLWASSNDIVRGYTDGSFMPDRTATRAEMAAILHRYCVR